MTNDLNSTWYELLRTISEHIEQNSIRSISKIESPTPQIPAGREIFLKNLERAIVRPAFEGDLTGICELVTELGYPSDDGAVFRRLMSLSKSADDLVLVVVSQEKLLGWIQISDRETLEGGKRLEIVGLVVAKSARRNGVASALVRETAKVATHRGRDVVVRTNIAREDARTFYESVGFKETKVQRVFVGRPENLFSM